MAAELRRIEAKYKRISELLDQVPVSLKDGSRPHPQASIAPVTLAPPEDIASDDCVSSSSADKKDILKQTIDSVDSQATFVDESEVANKNIFSNGIIQLFGGNEKKPERENKNATNGRPPTAPRVRKGASCSQGNVHVQLVSLQQELERKDRTIREYQAFISNIMGTLQQLAADVDFQQVTVRSFVPN